MKFFYSYSTGGYLFVISLLLISFGLGGGTAAAEKNTPEAVVLKMLTGFENHDLKVMEEVYAEKALSYWSLGLQIQGRKNHLEEYKIGFKNHEKFKTKWQLILQESSSDLAVVIGKVSWYSSSNQNTQKPDYILKSTFVLKKHKKTWQILHEHSSPEAL